MIGGLRTRLESLVHDLPQVAMAVVVISLGVALASGVLLANRSLRERFDGAVEALAGVADLQVTAVSGGTFDAGILDAIRAVPGVKAAAPLLLAPAFTRHGGEVTRLRVVGVDLLDDATVRVYRGPGGGAALEDPLLFLSQQDSVLIPRALATRLGVPEDGAFDVETALGPRRLVARGLLDDSGVAVAENLLVMDLFAAQEALGADRRASQIDVVATTPGAVAGVREALAGVLPSHLDVAPVAERRRELARAASAFQAMLDAIAAMGLVLAVLITGNRLATLYQGRLREMAVQRALGLPPGALVRGLVAESLMVSAGGVLIGLPVGVGVARLIVQPVADTMSLNLQQVVTASGVTVRPGPLLAAGAAGLLAGALAALLPALRVARARIVTVLGAGPGRDAAPEGRVKRLGRVAAVAGALTLLVLQLATPTGGLAGLTMACVALAGALGVEPGLRWASRPLGSVLGPAARIGVEDQGRSPRRAVGAAIVLMTGVAVVIWIGSMARSFESYVVRNLMLDRESDLSVDSGFNDLTVGDDARIDGAMLQRLAQIPGVRAVGAGVNAVSLRPATGLVAADPIRFRDPAFGAWPLADGAWPDALERVARGEALLADATLASRRALAVGAPVRITTPSGVLELPLAGITPTKFRSPAGDVMLSREVYQRWWGDGTITQAFLVLEPGASASEVTEVIQGTLGREQRLRVLTRDELAGWYGAGVRRAFSFLGALAGLVLVVVTIGTGDALAASVLERTREVGALRALGLTRRDIGAQVVAQALAIALVGLGLGLAVGHAMSFAFVEGLIPSLLGWRLELHASWQVATLAAVLGAAACLVGAALPAARASRMSAIEALRCE
ncbi:MAG: ABC transporter permease [Deltaproteobacteria bacterium]|nr:ABC transporter permease [Deltaproteobacteria bacterium]